MINTLKCKEVSKIKTLWLPKNDAALKDILT
jgi:hypothetical protein